METEKARDRSRAFCIQRCAPDQAASASSAAGAAANRIDKDAAVELLGKSLSAKKAVIAAAEAAEAEEAEAA